ncbi:glycoside hydrolase family 131 protein [Aulographum hederae CBS 113979]|uniref:Glycoside hydrolase family 131 protein n=1 Tax=Aulographum hederae CBS 113979 TaxID=1176131 RepID=A0A6G1GYJ0_9PEZI|nr:glycoside hydrolase family 131 protein [Aulographum hederae CBS 113979]
MYRLACVVAGLAGAVSGSVLWDGRLNEPAAAADLGRWSWESQVGSYQYYIHGTGEISKYVNLSPDFKNPADTASKEGIKITIDETAKWNSDMWRTELIPETKAAINKGKVFYHFSMMRKEENAPNDQMEHQINFFESHFTEMKYGLNSGEQGTSNPNLQWWANSQSQWKAPLEPGVWHNVAYEIDFDGGSVGFWHSTGAEELTQTVPPVKVSPSSNGADWHLGVLRLPKGGGATTPEDWYFSGVYIESGPLTTSVSGPGAAAAGSAADVAPAASNSSQPSSRIYGGPRRA